MDKKYIIGAVIVGALFIGWAWLNQPESVVSNNNAPSASVDAPAVAPAPKGNSGDVNF